MAKAGEMWIQTLLEDVNHTALKSQRRTRERLKGRNSPAQPLASGAFQRSVPLYTATGMYSDKMISMRVSRLLT